MPYFFYLPSIFIFTFLNSIFTNFYSILSMNPFSSIILYSSSDPISSSISYSIANQIIIYLSPIVIHLYAYSSSSPPVVVIIPIYSILSSAQNPSSSVSTPLSSFFTYPISLSQILSYYIILLLLCCLS
jgi:hypothetical protein